MLRENIRYWTGLILAMGTALVVGVPGLPKPQVPHPFDAYVLVVTTLAAGAFAYFINPVGPKE